MAGTGHTAGRIVVGVDGSMSSERTLRWALDQARLTGATVVAVHAWEVPASYGVPVVLNAGEDLAGDAERLLVRLNVLRHLFTMSRDMTRSGLAGFEPVRGGPNGLRVGADERATLVVRRRPHGPSPSA